MSDLGGSERPELTRSDYDRLIAFLRSSQTDQTQAAATCHELDKELHGISVKLDQMQQATNDRFDQMQQATNNRFDQMQQATNDRFDQMQQAMDRRFDQMRRPTRAASILCSGYSPAQRF
jgi:DNA anti-recombination protein RmuC